MLLRFWFCGLRWVLICFVSRFGVLDVLVILGAGLSSDVWSFGIVWVLAVLVVFVRCFVLFCICLFAVVLWVWCFSCLDLCCGLLFVVCCLLFW